MSDNTVDGIVGTVAPERCGGSGASNRALALRRALSARARRRLVLAPVLAVTFAFYCWTATTNGNPRAFGSQSTAYDRLTEAFLHGHLSLLTRVPTGLLALPDPYNPTQNAPWLYRFWDLALYHGHFYVTWGPTPVVTLLAPWRLLHLGALPLGAAIVIYGALGLLGAAGLLCFLADRYLPGTKDWQLAVAVAALGFCDVIPFLLRRPDVYEVAVASAFCFAMVAAYLLATGGLGTRLRPWRLGLGSLCVGLAAGGRPSLVFEGVLLVALWIALTRRTVRSAPRHALRLGLVLGAPCAAVMALLLAYNAARFGSLLQVGTSYTLDWHLYSPSGTPVTSLAYLVHDAGAYLFTAPRLTYAFPYLSLAVPAAYSSKIHAGEITGGLLFTTPIVLALVAAIPVLLRRGNRGLASVVAAQVLVGVLVLAFVSSVFGNTTMRYETDFASFFLVPALLAWFALMRGRWRRVAATLGTIAVAFGCVLGLAISITGYYDNLRTSHPATYWNLARLTSGLPTLATMVVGHPVIARVIDPSDLAAMGNAGTSDIGTIHTKLSGSALEIDIVSPRAGRFALAPTFSRAPGVAAPVDIVVSAPGTVREVPVGTGRTGLPLRLTRGLNRIRVKAVAKGVPPDVPLVSVDGFVLAIG